MTLQPAPPRLATPRTSRPTRGHQVAAVAKAMGTPLMPWARYVADVATEYDPTTGLPVYGVVVVSTQRQASKSTLLGVVSTHRCLSRPRARVWMTNQSGKEASDWVRSEYVPLLEASPVFRGHFRTRLGAGTEAVSWPVLGSTFRPFPPLRDALHGKQSDLVGVDEAWVHDQAKGEDLRQAIRPTQATRPGAQTWILSTAGDDQSDYLRGYVESGREAVLAGRTSGIAFFDWGLQDGVDPEDLDAIIAAHPAAGISISRESIEAARDDFGSDVNGWARAFGNVWSSAQRAAISPALWAAAGTERTDMPSRFALAFDAAPDRSDAAFVAAWRDADGLAYVEVVDRRPGTAWVRDRGAELGRKYGVPIAYDAMGSSLDLADELARVRPKVTLQGMATADFATACSAFHAAVVDGRLRHFRQRALDEAVAAAGKRVLGDRWAWSRRASTASIAPLVAASVALRQWDSSVARPRPRLVVASDRKAG